MSAWGDAPHRAPTEISVVVPTYNRRDLVRRTLETLFAQNFSKRFEIIVVIDGSTDGTAEALGKVSPPIPLIVSEQPNRGLAAARNSGLHASQSELILFLDDDMLCDTNLISSHVACHREHKNSIAFGALFASPASPPSLALECFKREIGDFHLRHARDPTHSWQLENCVFSNSSVPRQMVQACGGFDETFRMREDLELGVRLMQAGARPIYVPSAIAYHYYEKSSEQLLRDSEAFAYADVLFARKHPHHLVPGQLYSVAMEPLWKRRLRKRASMARGVDAILALCCRLGETFIHITPLRELGIRALQIRRRLRWDRKIRELGWDLTAPPISCNPS